MTSQDLRCFFRLAYPEADRPTLVTGGEHLHLTEVSEFGLRFHCADAARFSVGETFSGDIWFSDGERVSVAGEVLRHMGDEVVVHLDKGVTLRRMNMEQLRLLRAFAGRD